MNEDGEKRVRGKRSDEFDLINNLPDCLLCQVLLNLPTKVMVTTSVLSRRWRDLWKQVPVLDLGYEDFSQYNTFLSVVDSFLGLNSESSYLERFTLKYTRDGCNGYNNEPQMIIRWIDVAVKRKVKYLDVMDEGCDNDDVEIPPTVYTCESLVCLKLDGLALHNPKFVSLPSLKVINLCSVKFDDALALETLVSLSPVLESLTIESLFCDDVEGIRVRSQSLLSFTFIEYYSAELFKDLVVVVDAPRLKYLEIGDYRTASFILNNPASLVKADIDIMFDLGFNRRFDPNDLPKRNMLRNFLGGISQIKHMVISSTTLEIIYDYSKCEPLPLFRNLSFLHVKFVDYNWEILPIFLESCPNLKSLVVGSDRYIERERIEILYGPWCSLSSLEYVKIERPLKGKTMEMKLVCYLLENLKILKKLTLSLDDSIKKEESAVLKELLTIPRLSKSCRIVVT